MHETIRKTTSDKVISFFFLSVDLTDFSSGNINTIQLLLIMLIIYLLWSADNSLVDDVHSSKTIAGYKYG